MKRHFLAFCLICVVSLAAALVFYSCGDPFAKDLTGNVSITPPGPVDVYTELTAHYSGNENIEYTWRRHDSYYGTDQVVGSAVGNKCTPSKEGEYYVVVHGIAGRGESYKSKSSNIVKVIDNWLPTITTEYKEVESTGRLTITGFEEKYHNWEIKCNTPEESSLKIYAYETAYNHYEYRDGVVSKISLGGGNPGTLFYFDSGSSTYYVTLKMFKINDKNLNEGYTGNDKNVTLEVRMGRSTINNSDPKLGTVTVSFTDGVGSGVFVPDP